MPLVHRPAPWDLGIKACPGSPAQNSSGSLGKWTPPQPLRLVCHRGTVPKATCGHETKWWHRKLCTRHSRKLRTSHVSCSDSGHCLKQNKSWAVLILLPEPTVQTSNAPYIMSFTGLNMCCLKKWNLGQQNFIQQCAGATDLSNNENKTLLRLKKQDSPSGYLPAKASW